MKTNLLLIAVLFCSFAVFAQKEPEKMTPGMTEIWDPEVKVIQPGKNIGDAPSDAIVLFDGTNIDKEWTNSKGGEPGWKVADGCVTVVKGTGIIKTKRTFDNFQLHIEWRTPSEVVGKSQGRGNSGVFLQEIYEVQVLDNYKNRTYRNGQAGSIYKQYAPLVNACKKPGEWQTYDIIYTAPVFAEDGTYAYPPRVTVIHNGVLVQNNVSLRGPTEYIGIPEYSVKPHGAGSIVLQDHGNPVSYKNIWVREL
ncbi:putative multi-domain protein [hydrothermal vent metagenome]|uniref:Putative multi-domain protein n=1 Tax=hydrothermal vent metagenome TaxID=652676 RepID=A0A3B0U7G4_9ZZZZ